MTTIINSVVYILPTITALGLALKSRDIAVDIGNEQSIELAYSSMINIAIMALCFLILVYSMANSCKGIPWPKTQAFIVLACAITSYGLGWMGWKQRSAEDKESKTIKNEWVAFNIIGIITIVFTLLGFGGMTRKALIKI